MIRPPSKTRNTWKISPCSWSALWRLPDGKRQRLVVAHLVLEDFLDVALSATMQEIRDRFLADEKAISDSNPSTEKEAA